MKNQLQIITILVMILGSLWGTAQEKIHTDTINGNVIEYKGYTDEEFKDLKVRLRSITEYLEERHELFVSDKKTEFKDRIEKINASVENGTATLEESEKIKKEHAEDLARLIAAHRAKVDAHLNLIRTNRASSFYDFTLEEEFDDQIEISSRSGINIILQERTKTKRKYISTYSGFTLAFGYNFINGDDLGINDFSYPNNNYFSIGYQWKTTLDKDKNNFRLLYGVEYQSHGTELNGNRVFSQGDQSLITPLATSVPVGASVSKAKFRQDQIVFPLHLEIGGAKRKEYEDGRVRFSEDRYWKVGIGGFAGFNTSSRLKLKYELDGRDIKETRINNFNNEKFIYGLDAYVGTESLTFFGRMNLNNVFQNNSVDGQYITFGIRFQ